jgi:hypothetical protein
MGAGQRLALPWIELSAGRQYSLRGVEAYWKFKDGISYKHNDSFINSLVALTPLCR